MERSTANSSAMTVAVVTLAVLAVLFAMREAQAIVVPTLMAFFLALLLGSGGAKDGNEPPPGATGSDSNQG